VTNPARTYFCPKVKVSSIAQNQTLDVYAERDDILSRAYHDNWSTNVRSLGYTHAPTRKTGSRGNYRALITEDNIAYDSPRYLSLDYKP